MIKYLPRLWWPLFFLFLLHQLLEKVFHFSMPVLDNYLDPLLAMPLLLGLHLAERRFFFRQGINFSLPLFEIICISFFFALLFEEIFPLIKSGFVRDPWDYCCYAMGTLIFMLFMNKNDAKV